MTDRNIEDKKAEPVPSIKGTLIYKRISEDEPYIPAIGDVVSYLENKEEAHILWDVIGVHGTHVWLMNLKREKPEPFYIYKTVFNDALFYHHSKVSSHDI